MGDAHSMRLSERDIAAARDVTALPVVPMQLDGTSVFAAFEPDRREHDRRAAAGAGAVTSTALLHGLWLLPEGFPVPVETIPPVKRRRLREAQQFVVEGPMGFERLYSPPGSVRAVGFAGAELMRTIRRAARLTPIVQRVAVTDKDVRRSSRSWRAAEEWGIGLVQHVDSAARVLLEPEPPVLGVPAVYRWWIAELAYESWLKTAPSPSAEPWDPLVP